MLLSTAYDNMTHMAHTILMIWENHMILYTSILCDLWIMNSVFQDGPLVIPNPTPDWSFQLAQGVFNQLKWLIDFLFREIYNLFEMNLYNLYYKCLFNFTLFFRLSDKKWKWGFLRLQSYAVAVVHMHFLPKQWVWLCK